MANARNHKTKSILDFFKAIFRNKEIYRKMASIDIFSVQPHQVSRDMRGYSVFMYGGWKTR